MLRRNLSGNFRKTHAIALLTLLLVATVALQPAQAQTYTVLHSFIAGTDGAVPSPIIRDAQGNLYGTTKFGGIPTCGLDTCGTVYKIDSAGNETVLYSFEGGSNGSDPMAGLVEDAAGNLYGTTQGNGYIGGDSVVFKLDPNGQETSFPTDGLNACCLDSPLAVDAEGNVYGMSPYGGEPNCGLNSDGLGCGTLFKLTPNGKLTVLHVFDGTDGMQPEGGVVLDGKGNLYGTAYFGGMLSCKYPGEFQEAQAGCGTIYKLDRSGKFTVLHTFAGPGDGSTPLGLIIDPAGNLYGIAAGGGNVIPHTDFEYGVGTIFKVDTSGQFSVLFTFAPCTAPPCTQGQVRNPVFAYHLVKDSRGNLYGIEEVNNCSVGGGCLFRLDTKANLTNLYDFTPQESGAPFASSMGLVLGSDGDVYGSTPIGGPPQAGCQENGFTQGCGSVFHLAQ